MPRIVRFWSLYLSTSSTNDGISCLQGAHQVAQKLTRRGRALEIREPHLFAVHVLEREVELGDLSRRIQRRRRALGEQGVRRPGGDGHGDQTGLGPLRDRNAVHHPSDLPIAFHITTERPWRPDSGPDIRRCRFLSSFDGSRARRCRIMRRRRGARTLLPETPIDRARRLVTTGTLTGPVAATRCKIRKRPRSSLAVSRRGDPMRMRRLRMFSLPFGALAVALTGLAVPADAQIASVAKTPVDTRNFMVRLGVCPVRFQTPYVPYFGKNRVRYDKFEWHIYKTDHFDIFYYPELEKHLERVAGYAESAYQRISAELKHDLAERVPLILFKTQSEFQQQNIAGGELPEGVLAFAEPERNRMVLPIDEPPDQLYRLITHELTHVFEFDIIPRGIIGDGLPLWVDEGLANYMAGYWNILDLMQVRDAALTDNVPRMSQFETAAALGPAALLAGPRGVRVHRIEVGQGRPAAVPVLAAQERARRRRERVRGSAQAQARGVRRAVRSLPQGAVQAVPRQGAAGRLRPQHRAEPRAHAVRRRCSRSSRRRPATSSRPSSATARDQELDIVLALGPDGQVIRNLTEGFDKDRGFEYIATAGGLRGNLVPWIALGAGAATGSPTSRGPRRTRRSSSRTSSPARSSSKIELEDGRRARVAGVQPGRPEGRVLGAARAASPTSSSSTSRRGAVDEPDQGRDRRLRADVLARRQVDRLHGARRRQRQAVPARPGDRPAKKQLTFGAHDDTAREVLRRPHDRLHVDGDRSEVDDSPPRSRATATSRTSGRSTCSNGELRQWTDTATGNVSPVVLQQPAARRASRSSRTTRARTAFTRSPANKPIATVASADFGAPARCSSSRRRSATRCCATTSTRRARSRR